MRSSPNLYHVKIPIAYSSNLISHFQSLLYADQKSYMSDGDDIHTFRVTTPQTCQEREEAFDLS